MKSFKLFVESIDNKLGIKTTELLLNMNKHIVLYGLIRNDGRIDNKIGIVTENADLFVVDDTSDFYLYNSNDEYVAGFDINGYLMLSHLTSYDQAKGMYIRLMYSKKDKSRYAVPTVVNRSFEKDNPALVRKYYRYKLGVKYSDEIDLVGIEEKMRKILLEESDRYDYLKHFLTPKLMKEFSYLSRANKSGLMNITIEKSFNTFIKESTYRPPIGFSVSGEVVINHMDLEVGYIVKIRDSFKNNIIGIIEEIPEDLKTSNMQTYVYLEFKNFKMGDKHFPGSISQSYNTCGIEAYVDPNNEVDFIEFVSKYEQYINEIFKYLTIEQKEKYKFLLRSKNTGLLDQVVKEENFFYIDQDKVFDDEMVLQDPEKLLRDELQTSFDNWVIKLDTYWGVPSKSGLSPVHSNKNIELTLSAIKAMYGVKYLFQASLNQFHLTGSKLEFRESTYNQLLKQYPESEKIIDKWIEEKITDVLEQYPAAYNKYPEFFKWIELAGINIPDWIKRSNKSGLMNQVVKESFSGFDNQLFNLSKEDFANYIIFKALDKVHNVLKFSEKGSYKVVPDSGTQIITSDDLEENRLSCGTDTLKIVKSFGRFQYESLGTTYATNSTNEHFKYTFNLIKTILCEYTEVGIVLRYQNIYWRLNEMEKWFVTLNTEQQLSAFNYLYKYKDKLEYITPEWFEEYMYLARGYKAGLLDLKK